MTPDSAIRTDATIDVGMASDDDQPVPVYLDDTTGDYFWMLDGIEPITIELADILASSPCDANTTIAQLQVV